MKSRKTVENMDETYGKSVEMLDFTDDVKIFQKKKVKVQYGLKMREHDQYAGDPW